MKIELKQISLLFLIFVSLSYSVNGQTLRKDPVVKKHFTSNEVEDLAAILNTFDSIMVGTNKLDKATLLKYQQRVTSTINQAAEEGTCCEFLISPHLAIEILDSISESTFTKLFRILRVSDNERIKLYFWPKTIDMGSNYRQLASEITNPAINKYLQNISASGDVNLSLTYQFYSQIDLTDDKQRLLMAIDFISFTIQNHADKNRVFNLAIQKSNLEEVRN